jgi:hypothetical protein
MIDKILAVEEKIEEAADWLADAHTEDGCLFNAANTKDVGCLACLAQLALAEAQLALSDLMH